MFDKTTTNNNNNKQQQQQQPTVPFPGAQQTLAILGHF